MSASAALIVAMVLAGCGKSYYFAGRTLPPSGLLNRVLIAIQNPNAASTGALQFVDAYYDIRYSYDYKIPAFQISGYKANLPLTIQNLPEEQVGAVYASGDGSLRTVSYAQEKAGSPVEGLINGASSSVFVTRNGAYVIAASQSAHVLTVTGPAAGGSYGLSLPGVYRVSVNPGGSVALAFVQNSNYVYYPMKLTTQQKVAYAGGPANWPVAAMDCEPRAAPNFCLFQAQSPDHVDATGTHYGAPLTFDRPVKAIFSSDGSTAYILNCGPECGGSTASVTPLPIGPMIFINGQATGILPTTSTLASSTINIPGGASNALVDASTMYIVGQQPQQVQGQTLFGGNLTVLNLQNNSVSAPISVSDGAPGAMSRILQADDNTLWIGMTKCTNGVRSATGEPYGCLTMYNTVTNTVTLLESYRGDLTGIAAVTGLHKIYVAEGGQVYIFSTVDGLEKNNQFVAVTGTASDVAYMDGLTDANNTVY